MKADDSGSEGYTTLHQIEPEYQPSIYELLARSVRLTLTDFSSFETEIRELHRQISRLNRERV